MKTILKLLIFLFLGLSTNLNAQHSPADSLFEVGNELVNKSEYSQAIDYLKKAREFYIQANDSVNWLGTSNLLGESYIRTGSVKAALELLLEVDELHINQVPLLIKSTTKKDIGLAYRYLEEYKKSQDYYFESLEFATESGDSLAVARLYNNISYTYQKTGDYETALEFQHKAKDHFEAIGSDEDLSNVLNGIFLSLMDVGLYEQATPYIRKSLAIREKLQDPRMLDIAYHNLAWNFKVLGKRDSSIIYYQKSLELSRMLNNPYDISATLLNIGQLYEQSGNFGEALVFYNEALELNRNIDRTGYIAKTLSYIARTAVLNGDYINAKNFFEEAESYFEESASPSQLVDFYIDVASFKILQGEFFEAEKWISKAESIVQEKDYITYQLAVYKLRADLYRSQGMLRKSLSEFKKRYDLALTRAKSRQLYPTMHLAQAYYKVDSDSAFIFADKVFKILDSTRTNVAGITFRAGFFRDFADFYNEVSEWYISKNNDPEKAFELAEKAKARVLMDELADAQERAFSQLDESTLIKKQLKVREIDRLYDEIEHEQNPVRKYELRRQLKDTEFEYEAIINELNLKYVKQTNIKSPEPITLSDAQDFLDSQSAIIKFAFSGQKLLTFFINHSEIKATVTDSIGEKSALQFYSDRITEFRNLIENQVDVSTLNTISHELYNSLLKDILNKVNDPQNLLFVSSGPLSFLPFEALTVNHQYLIEKYSIKYMPSVSVIPFIQEPHRQTEFELLALAGAGFNESEPVNNTRSQISFASLPSTIIEVDAIAKNFTKATVLKDDDLNEAEIKSHDLDNYRFLHFATHGIIDLENPSQSGLLLSQPSEMESVSVEDGFLNSTEISMLNLDADLVVLSACKTGIGKIISGEGLLGLQRSFFTAGASSVMVSLWDVYDKSTSTFMDNFYRNLLLHQNEVYGMWNKSLDWLGLYEHPLFDYKTKALRDAKLQMINHPYYSHPIHWAPFILIGK